MEHHEVVVVGGGLAGLSAAIHLGLNQKKVLLVEKGSYPGHKVCGEYVSREVVPYLKYLGISLEDGAQIDRFQLSNRDGNTIETTLPLGGIGISRYALDHRMYKRALDLGVEVLFDTVCGITFDGDNFKVQTSQNQEINTDLLIGAFGKRSNVDKMLKRPFMEKNSPWVGVKAHYEFDGHPEDLVGIHAFKGGYGGISRTESGAVNFCYMAHYNSFKSIGNIDDFNQKIVAENPFLRELLSFGTALMSRPLTISQISFQRKRAVEDHIIMCGDAAGLIHPLCGNGMAMAIHSAQIAASLICKYLDNPQINRSDLEQEYQRQWTKNFAGRLWWGRRLQYLMLSPALSDLFLHIFSGSRRLTRSVIKRTHGKTLEVI